MPATIILNGPPVQVGVNASTGVRLEKPGAGNVPATGSYLWLSAAAGVTSGVVYVETASVATQATDGVALGAGSEPTQHGYLTVPVSAMPYPLEVRSAAAIVLHGDGTFNVQAQLR